MISPAPTSRTTLADRSPSGGGILPAHPVAAVALVLAVAVAGHATAQSKDSIPIGPFLAAHCFDCHGPEKQKGDLRLDELPTDFNQAEASGTWTEVLAKIQAGEMPPKKRKRPPKADLSRAAAWIESNLVAAETHRNREQGRVVLRRLNGVEYENTINDLLTIRANLKDLLPPDGTAHGFDNVGEALTTSSILMERYLEAADTALDQAIVPGPRPQRIKTRFSYKDDKRIIDNKNIFRPIDDAVVFFSSGYSPTVLREFRAPADGTYRFRVSAYAFQSKEPVTFRIYAGNVIAREGRTHLVGYYDAQPRPTVIDFTDRLDKGDSIRIVPYGTGHRIYQIKGATYPHPGLAVQWVEVEGPLHDTWPPESHRKVFGDLRFTLVNEEQIRRNKWTRPRYEIATTNPTGDAETIVRRFARRAFRRPIDAEAATPYVQLVRSRLEAGDSFEQAIRIGLKAILCSPDFLFLNEDPGPLDDFALASRLSYFLWSTMPDQKLLELATDGKLRDSAVLRGQTERLLEDSRADAFTRNFVGQWLGLRDIDFTTPDKKLYPEFDELLKVSMVQETQLFFQHILEKDLSLLNFVDSEFAIINERLARHYGIRGVEGLAFRKVTVPPQTRRGGVMTQASVLKVTANGTNTSPVMRGAWVLQSILGQPAPPPPGNVPAVEPDIRGTTTIRQQLDKHRSDPTCASCHDRIDPPGFALENFDVIGGWQSYYRSLGTGDRVQVKVNGNNVQYRKGPAVNAAGSLPDGRRFRDIYQYKRLLLENKGQIARCLTGKLLTYATGGAIGLADRPEVERIVARIRSTDYGLRSLVHEVVQSTIFRHK